MKLKHQVSSGNNHVGADEAGLTRDLGQDIRRPRAEIYHVGAEYRYVNLLAVRLGYIHDDDGDFSDPTYGLGFIYKDRLSLDYANVPQAKALERVHRWSLYWTF